MTIRRLDEGTYEDREHDKESRRWSGREEEPWPPSRQVGEHDRPWQHPEETWSSRRGMYGMGGPSRGYNAGGYGRGAYERGYEMRSYDALLDASERRGQGKAPKGYVRSDERIREDICERLMRSPLDASDVDVQVKDGEVTLVGTVRSRGEKRGIEDVAHAVSGVHDVHNRIRLGVQGTSVREEGDGADTLHS